MLQYQLQRARYILRDYLRTRLRKCALPSCTQALQFEFRRAT